MQTLTDANSPYNERLGDKKNEMNFKHQDSECAKMKETGTKPI